MAATKRYAKRSPCQHGAVWSHCRDCQRANLRTYRARTANRVTRKYEKTPNGFLMRTYRNMLSRVTGVQWKKAHLYQGLSILPREQFYAWARGNADFWRLWRVWEASGYERRLTPSVNRIRATEGYELSNMEWLTHGVNSSLANHSRIPADTQRRLRALIAA